MHRVVFVVNQTIRIEDLVHSIGIKVNEQVVKESVAKIVSANTGK